MRILVINLERSQDRRAFMQAQFDALGIEAEFVKAVDASRGEHTSVSRYDERKALWRLGHPLQPAEVGCFASHYLVWKRCAESGESVLIMEDDTRLREGFPTAVQMAERLIGRCRFVRLYAMSDRRKRKIVALPGDHELVRYLKGPYGLQCYGLSPEGAQVLLRHADVWINAVDTYVDQFWDHGLASLAILPFHVEHAGVGDMRSLVSGVAGTAPRPAHRILRRALTHFYYRVRRGWFNLRYQPPPPLALEKHRTA